MNNLQKKIKENKSFSLEDATIGFVGYIALQYAIILLLTGLMQIGLPYTTATNILASFIIELAFVISVLLVTMKNNQNIFYATKLNVKPSVNQIIFAVITAAICLLCFSNLTNAFLLFMRKIGYSYVTSDLVVDTFGKYVLYTLTMCVVPAICEEVLFRGLIFNGLRKYNTKFAIVISALLFMLMHGSPDQTVHQFILGIILALAFLITGSLWVPIIIHFLNNFLSLTISFAYSRTEVAESTAEAVITWSDVASYAFYGLVGAGIACALLYFLIKWMISERAQMKAQKVKTQTVETIVDGTVVQATVDNIQIEQEESEEKDTWPFDFVPTKRQKFSKLAIVLLIAGAVVLAVDWIIACVNGFIK